MLVMLVISVAVWLGGRQRLPRELRIATGEEGGLYYQVGNSIERSLGERTGRSVSVLTTRGTAANFGMLVDGKADLAILQGGAVRLEEVTVVTPVFPELLFVIVRKGQGIETVADLRGRSVAIGKEGSGTRESAVRLLKHFELAPRDVGDSDAYFKLILDDPSIDGAIVTAGIENRDLREVLASREFDLIPIRVAPAIEMVDPYLRNVEIPRGLFVANPPVPAEATPTIATTAFLATRADAPDRLVRSTLACIHEESLRLRIPTLIPREEANKWIVTRLHPVARRYFNPADNIGMLANVMESLAATKELLFALAAGIYVLWVRWRRLKEKEVQKRISIQKERLDKLLLDTLRIEREQMGIHDCGELQSLLEQVTTIKLKALQEFTDEELRGDQSFSIFLEQCGSLVSKIQLKIMATQS